MKSTKCPIVHYNYCNGRELQTQGETAKRPSFAPGVNEGENQAR